MNFYLTVKGKCNIGDALNDVPSNNITDATKKYTMNSNIYQVKYIGNGFWEIEYELNYLEIVSNINDFKVLIKYLNLNKNLIKIDLPTEFDKQFKIHYSKLAIHLSKINGEIKENMKLFIRDSNRAMKWAILYQEDKNFMFEKVKSKNTLAKWNDTFN